MKLKQLASKRTTSTNGFSLAELMTAVAVIGTLSAISIPSYIDQVKRGCQSEPESIINQVMMQAQAYNDEFGNPASGWSDLDKIATLMTKDGRKRGAANNEKATKKN